MEKTLDKKRKFCLYRGMLFGEKTPIGLDIGAGFLKVARIKEMRGGYELEDFDMIPLPPELIVDGAIIDSLRLADSIKELLRKTKIKTKEAAISVSGHSSVIIKMISLPEMSEEELEESIKFEAEQYVPFDINDVNIDFQIIGPREEPGQMDVILVAVKKDVINEYVSVVKDAGLTPVIVDVDVFALENMYELNYEISASRNVALVDIGASSIKMNIIKGGTPSFTRDGPVGSNLHSEALQREFHIPYEVAERLKRGETVENVSEEEARTVIEAASEEIFNEIGRSLEYFRTSMAKEEVAELILSGGCALIEGFPEMLAERLSIEVKIANPFQNITISKKLDEAYIRDIAPIAAVSVGLAIRRVGDR
ncbi:Type IV pilus biogenesis protein PilM [hydrothermal vent metagenome]|uniref:Type IV pilus biogenesis protein PilM n=1 Tax=hydrothermal vent metagenome TaxID=652676 RepID=A0A3B1CW46_9ZZZZ